MKECAKCGEVKSLDLFHFRKSSKDGRRADCKTCFSKQQNNYKRNKKVYSPFINFLASLIDLSRSSSILLLAGVLTDGGLAVYAGL